MLRNRFIIISMKYIGIKEAAKKWGISDRRVRILCQEGRIEGAIKLEWSWTIPADTPKPTDGRSMRHLKNYDLRLGSIDISRLNELKEKHPVSFGLSRSDAFGQIVKNLICYASSLGERKLDPRIIATVLSGKISHSAELSEHLLICNFRSVLISQIRTPDVEWNTKRLLELNRSLLQGVDDEKGGVLREGVVDMPLTEKDMSLSVSLQVETLFNQYEMEWKRLHPVFRSVLLYAGLLRIKPFDAYNEEFAVLVLLSMLLSAGFILPSLEDGDVNEMNAATAVAFRRGYYQDLARIIERKLFESYEVLEGNA